MYMYNQSKALANVKIDIKSKLFIRKLLFFHIFSIIVVSLTDKGQMIWDTSEYINISINTPTTQSEDVKWGEGCKFIGCGTKRD